LLNDGTVLVAGGLNGSGSVSTAELFDATSGSFTPTGGMTTVRAAHTATLLKNGTALLAGGRDINGDTQATAELYQ
jgi:hypothetical protein